MLCKFCEKSPPSVKAHSTPRSFFLAHAKPGEAPQLVSPSPKFHPKRLPIGVYDQQMLCSKCEPKFSAWDSYGYQFFHSAPPEQIFSDRVAAYRIANVDYSKLKLFVISVLWRCSVSTQDFYSDVSLGPYEDRAKRHLLDSTPGPYSEFAIFVERFTHPAHLIPMLCPLPTRIDGIRFYQFVWNGYLVSVKTDGRSLPIYMERVVLRPGQPLIILPREYLGSDERELMAAAAKHARFPKARVF